jgi:hypothetical protein
MVCDRFQGTDRCSLNPQLNMMVLNGEAETSQPLLTKIKYVLFKDKTYNDCQELAH